MLTHDWGYKKFKRGEPAFLIPPDDFSEPSTRDPRYDIASLAR